jgi:hypothetical protein
MSLVLANRLRQLPVRQEHRRFGKNEGRIGHFPRFATNWAWRQLR